MATEEVVTNIQPSELNNSTLRKVGVRLKNRFDGYKRDRRNVEDQWLKNLRQFSGEYDPGVNIPADKSRAYPKITRMKVVGMVGKLMSLLFPEGEDNWSLEASEEPQLDQESLETIVGEFVRDNPNQELTLEKLEQLVEEAAQDAATRMSRRIRDQLADAVDYGQEGYPTLARKVIHSAVLYSTGVLKGPMTIERRGVSYSIGLNSQVEIDTTPQYRPYFEFVRLWDYFPDMQARSFDQMDGEFQRHVMSKHHLLKLAEREDFFGNKIKEFLRNHPDGNYEPANYESSLKSMEQSHQPSNNKNGPGKFEVLEYWGSVYAADLKGAGEDMDEIDDDEEVNGTVWLIEDTVIKAARNPFPEGTNMFHKFVFEDDEVNLCGSGLPPIVRDSQMGVANSARMMLDNAASVAGPMSEVNVDLLAPGQGGPKFQPFETVFREGSGGDAQIPAVRNLHFESRLQELLQVFNQYKRMADEETFVSDSTQGGTGNIPGEALRSQGNASMILGQASLPFRDIVRNFDSFTVSVIHALVQWNRVFHPITSADGELRPRARGSTSLMAKETQAAALDQLAQTMTPDERPHINPRELARSRLATRDLPNKLMRTEREAQQAIESQEQERQQQQQIDQAAQQAELQKTQAETQTERAQAAQTAAQAQGESASSDKDRASAIKDLVDSGIALEQATQQVLEQENQSGNNGQQGGEPSAGV